MQPLAMYALASGAVMILGASATLLLARHNARPRRKPVNRWQVNGSLPLAGAALAMGAISLSNGQSPTTHEVIYVVGAMLLLAALLCALVGAVAASRQ